MRMDSRFAVGTVIATLLCGCDAPTMQSRITDSIGTLSHVQSSPNPVDSEIFREARGIAIVDETQAGLVISGAGVSLTSYALYLGFTQTPELNGVTRYTVSFKLLDG